MAGACGDDGRARGSLAGSGTRLPFHAVVTTTWGDWRRDHPSTTVLSLDTGYERNYAEGAAYRDYFATDRLMFEVPTSDTRLKNKAEVLVLRAEILGKGAMPVAIAVERLRREPVYAFEAAGRRYVVPRTAAGRKPKVVGSWLCIHGRYTPESLSLPVLTDSVRRGSTVPGRRHQDTRGCER